MSTLNAGQDAQVNAPSCASAGNCSADGFYTDASQLQQEFVVNEKNGVWGNAEKVLVQNALGPGGPGNLSDVSCGSAGNCATGGVFYPASGPPQAIVVTEKHGTWGAAKEVPGSGALNQGGSAAVNSVSCASAGNCSAGGFYMDSSQHLQAFIADETGGTWGKAKEVPGSAALNTGSAQVTSVSCASTGNCSAIGFYGDSTGSTQTFTVGETGGTWGNAAEIPGSAALNSNNVSAFSVSCGSAGDCGATGSYMTSGGIDHAFVASETSGTWSNIEPVPGMTTLNPGGTSQGVLVSCRSLGHCTATGDYPPTTAGAEVFVVTER